MNLKTRDWAIAPGETLKEWIEHTNTSLIKVAFTLGLTSKELNRLFSGKLPIGQRLSIKLQKLTGIPSNFWNNYEKTYRNLLKQGATSI